MNWIPPGSVVWPTLRIAALAWLFLRAFVGFAAGSTALHPFVSFVLAIGVAFIALVDLSMNRERAWVGNLGVGRGEIFLLALVFAGVLEVVSTLALGWSGAFQPVP